MGLIARIMGILPRRWLLAVGAALGWLVFRVLRVRRRVAEDNIRAALGLPEGETTRLASKVYAHLATGALEFVSLERLDPAAAGDVLGEAGIRRLRAHLAGGRGLLVLTAHLGNWDLLCCAAALCGLPVNVVTRRIKTGWLDRYWMRARARCGVKLHPPAGSARALLRALGNNEIVALVMDQHQPGGAVVPFFGRPAATSTSLAGLARATGCAVVPVYLVRRGTGFQLVVRDPLELTRGSTRSDELLANTALFSAEIERVVTENPEQWLWLHRRWKITGPGRTISRDGTPRAER